MSERTLTKLAKPLLALAAFIWGSSFFIMKNSLDSMPVFFLLGTRFLAATGILSLIFLKRFSRLRGDYLSRGAIMGVLLFFAYTSQTFGLAGTTPSKNAFLTAAYCVLVPFFYWGISKTRPDRYHHRRGLFASDRHRLRVSDRGFFDFPRRLAHAAVRRLLRAAYRLRVHFRKRAGYYPAHHFAVCHRRRTVLAVQLSV
jgi:hypothetical protein